MKRKVLPTWPGRKKENIHIFIAVDFPSRSTAGTAQYKLSVNVFLMLAEVAIKMHSMVLIQENQDFDQ